MNPAEPASSSVRPPLDATGPVWAVVPAAGTGERLGAGRPKALVELAGRPMVVWCLRTLAEGGVVGVVVAGPQDPAGAAGLAAALAGEDLPVPVVVVAGGVDRTASVRAALARVPADAAVVLVHDAARPLVPVEVVRRVVGAVVAGAAGVVPALPVVDTVKLVVDDRVHATVDRGDLVIVQTPQGFRADVLRRAYAGAVGSATDDAGLVEAAGERVVVVAGDPAAFKVTRPLDLVLAEAMVSRAALSRPAATPDRTAASPALRTGVGVDTHAFDTGTPCHVAGLSWPDEPAGLAGHSDGDVAAHACCDALLSAAGLGDLGGLVGTDRPEWSGAPGGALLGEAARVVREAGWDIANIAVQVVGNRPRIGPRRAEAEAALSDACGAPVSVAGTTTDGLGFPGRGDGLTAVATALLVERLSTLGR